VKQTLTITNSVSEMAQIEPFLEEACEALQVPIDKAFSLQLAVDEGMANCVNYAYPQGEKGDITLTIEREEDTLILILIDSGVPFDPTAEAPEVNTTLSAEDRPIGGLGIFLINQMMDKVCYQRVDGKNILTMKKNI